METWILLVVIALFSGTIAGMGIGGGSIFILLTTIFSIFEHKEAQSYNLIMFVIVGIFATISNFKNKNIDKVITIEASGIAPAYATAIKLNVPLVILKKSQSNILNNNLYTTVVHSFTKNIDYNITCSQKFLLPNENILFIDDFLANGEAVLGAYRLCKMANCNLIGVGIVIEKSFQPGRKKLEHLNLNVHSLARIEKLSKGEIIFK